MAKILNQNYPIKLHPEHPLHRSGRPKARVRGKESFVLIDAFVLLLVFLFFPSFLCRFCFCIFHDLSPSRMFLGLFNEQFVLFSLSLPTVN